MKETEEKQLADLILYDMATSMSSERICDRWKDGRKASEIALKFIIDDIERTIFHLDDEFMLILLRHQKERYSEVLKEIKE